MKRVLAFLLVAGIGSAQSLPQPLPPQQQSPYGQPYGAQPQYGTQPQYGAQPLPPSAEQTQALSPAQLDDLVAPIALYPDELLGQILAASTYPLEIVDAEQWLQQNRNQQPPQLMSIAKQQTWDPSIQALVAFPDILDILGRDIRWTTDLGNAFLGQQADVMAAIQRLRARAQQSGALRSTPQQAVTTQYQDGQDAIQIQPADPQVVYVPQYQPYAVWGPPAYGAYPALWYPPSWTFGDGGYGIGFSAGTFLGNLFSGLLNFGGWGWGLNWFAKGLFLIPQFFAHFGFGGGFGGGYYGGPGYHGGFIAGHPMWIHDPGHRMGVPYGSHEVAARFGGRFEGSSAYAGNRGFGRSEAPRAQVGGGAYRGSSGGEAFRGNSFAARVAPQGNAFRGESQSRSFSEPANRSFSQPAARSFNQPAARSFSQPQGRSFNQPAARSLQPQARSFSQPQARSFSQPQARSFSQPQSSARSFAAPQQHFSAPKAPAQHFSAPKGGGGGGSRASSSHGGGGGHSSGGGHSGGHSSHKG